LRPETVDRSEQDAKTSRRRLRLVDAGEADQKRPRDGRVGRRGRSWGKPS